MADPLATIVRRVEHYYNGFHIKRYDFDGVPEGLKTDRFLGQVLDLVAKEAASVGNTGFAFVYGYQPEGTEIIVPGVDLTLFYGCHYASPLDSDILAGVLANLLPSNPIRHTWTVERQDGRLVKLKRSGQNHGTECALESAIAGEEAKTLLRSIARGPRASALWTYMHAWPDLDDLSAFLTVKR